MVTQPTRRTLGENIKALRDTRGMQQNALAAAVGTSPANVNKWEKNTSTPELDSLFKIAIALQVSIETLCEHVNPEYDASRQQAPAPARFAELWGRVDRTTRDHWWQVLLGLAGAPRGLDDEPVAPSSPPPSRVDPTP